MKNYLFSFLLFLVGTVHSQITIIEEDGLYGLNLKEALALNPDYEKIQMKKVENTAYYICRKGGFDDLYYYNDDSSKLIKANQKKYRSIKKTILQPWLLEYTAIYGDGDRDEYPIVAVDDDGNLDELNYQNVFEPGTYGSKNLKVTFDADGYLIIISDIRVKTRFQTTEVYAMGKNAITVRTDSGFVILNNHGQAYFTDKYVRIHQPIMQDYYVIMSGHKYGFFNPSKKIEVPLQYIVNGHQVFQVSHVNEYVDFERPFIVEKEGKYGFITAKDHPLLQTADYDTIIHYEYFFVCNKNNQWIVKDYKLKDKHVGDYSKFIEYTGYKEDLLIFENEDGSQVKVSADKYKVVE